MVGVLGWGGEDDFRTVETWALSQPWEPLPPCWTLGPAALGAATAMLNSGPCSAPFSRNLSRVGLRLPPGTNFVAKCFKLHCIPKANCYVFYKEPPPHFLVAGMKKGKARGLRSEWPLPWTEAAHGAPRNLHVQAHPSIRIPLIPWIFSSSMQLCISIGNCCYPTCLHPINQHHPLRSLLLISRCL